MLEETQHVNIQSEVAKKKKKKRNHIEISPSLYLKFHFKLKKSTFLGFYQSCEWLMLFQLKTQQQMVS